MTQPVFSVVTPFHNTERYLAQCIDSVLAQTFSDFEYVLVDNCSTDGSTRIAEAYARRDPRIRLVRQSQLLSQVENYNSALANISDASEYCKLVQADDFIFPNCLASMVQAFEQSDSIGLVSSYYLKGDTVRGSGYPYPAPVLSGKEVARMNLRHGTFVFGSPTAVGYRSSLVRQPQTFYDAKLLHEDTEKCMQILKDHDFGFVHQVLSFLRVDNESVSSAVRGYAPDALDYYIIVQRYAADFLDPEEAAALKAKSRNDYYRVLADEALKFREPAFWQYHQSGLRTLGETIDRPRLARRIGLDLAWMAANPGATLARAMRYAKRRIRGPTDSRGNDTRRTK